MQSKFILALTSAAVIAVAAGGAHAAISFGGYQTALNPGETLITGFEGGPALSAVTFSQPGYSLTGTATLFTGSQDGVTAAPAISALSRDTTQYLSIQAGQSATLETQPLQEISFYVGSLDDFNSFTFHLADGATEVVTGSTLAALPGMDANGNQTGFTTNGRLTFTFGSAVNSVELASSSNAFEVSDIAGVGGVVPEPSVWAMMILGLGAAGGALRRRRALAVA
ncbi:MAG TPA: PEPxxWA-CTERM sorting domain-containing protein [Caulobacteraceae bacterium]|jgi:hypothetical protein